MTRGPLTLGSNAQRAPRRGKIFIMAAKSSPVGSLQLVPASLRPLARRVRRWIRPEPTYRSPALRARAERFANSFPKGARLVDVGAGSKRLVEDIITVDVAPGPTVDVVAPAEKLPFPADSIDGLVLQAVLEHVRDAHGTLEEIARVLRPTGRAYVEIPFMQGFHADPGDYRRYTVDGLEQELEAHGLIVIEKGVIVGPGSAISAISAEYLALLLSGKSPNAFRLLRLLTSWLVLPLKFTDRWLDTHPMAFVIASGVYAEVEKPARVTTRERHSNV
jgi:SAM-dependent methyltransferase